MTVTAFCRVVIHPQVYFITAEDQDIQDYNFACCFCGCETWWLTLREERRLRVFENRVLRRIFGPKRDEVTGEWRKLHNEELNNLYSSLGMVGVIKSR
jgi:hypothetical protein